jgi:hypothetical protein
MTTTTFKLELSLAMSVAEYEDWSIDRLGSVLALARAEYERHLQECLTRR